MLSKNANPSLQLVTQGFPTYKVLPQPLIQCTQYRNSLAGAIWGNEDDQGDSGRWCGQELPCM